jgi:caffeoyl-CoA O-methyltransferase
MTTYKTDLSQYITDLFARQDEGLKLAWEDTQRKGLPPINVKAEEGRFLQFLVRAIAAKRAVEIGTLGGYSGIWIARGLVPGGKLITLEKEPYHAEVAREHFVAAAVDDRVEVRVGDAHKLLREMQGEGPFDFVFIDAEKPGYEDYFDWALENVRTGGTIAAHNAFRGGSIVGLREDDQYTQGMRNFNRRVAEEPNLISTIYPAGDGTLISVKTA